MYDDGGWAFLIIVVLASSVDAGTGFFHGERGNVVKKKKNTDILL